MRVIVWENAMEDARGGATGHVQMIAKVVVEERAKATVQMIAIRLVKIYVLVVAMGDVKQHVNIPVQIAVKTT